MEMLWILLFGGLLAVAALLPAAAVHVQATRRLLEVRDHYKKTGERLEAESLEARFTVDLAGNIRSYNNRAQQLFGFHSSEIIGKSVSKLLHVPPNVLPAGVVDTLYRAKRSEDRQGLEVVGCRKDGSFFPLELHISEAGGYMRRKFHMTARDLTERLQGADAARELRVLEAVLQCSAAPILIVNGEGEIQRYNTMFQKIAGYSHLEIHRRAFWDLLLEPADREHARLELKRLIARAGTGGQRMVWRLRSGRRQEFLVAAAGVPLHEIRANDDMPLPPAAILVAFPVAQDRELEDGETGHGSDTEPRPVFALDDVVSELRPLLSRMTGEAVHLSHDPASENPLVAGDRRALERLILTLVLSARDAMPEGGRLSMETSVTRTAEGDFGVLTVTESGSKREPWLPSEMAGLIGVVRAQGGNAIVQWIPSKGATMRIYLPAPGAKGLFIVKSAAG